MFFSHFLNWISCIEFLARNFLQRFCEKKFLTRNRAMYSQNHTMQVLFIVYSHNAVLKFSILLCVPKKRTYNGKNIWPKKNSQKTLSLSKKRRWFALAFLTLGWPLLWWGAHTHMWNSSLNHGSHLCWTFPGNFVSKGPKNSLNLPCMVA